MHRAKTSNLRTTIIYWFLTISYMGVIFYLSSLGESDLPALPGNFDKVIHIFLYLILAFLLSLSLNKSGIKRYVFLLAFLISVFYGASDEFHQSFVPDRDVSLYDLLADAFGAFLGGYFASKIIGSFVKKLKAI